MTPETLRQIMRNQGLNNRDLATISDVTERQVTSWLSGKYPVPMMISILLLGLESGAITQDWLLDVVQQELRENII